MSIAGQFKQKQPLEETVKIWNAAYKAADPVLRLMMEFEWAKEASRNPKLLDVMFKIGTKELRDGCADKIKIFSEMESDKAKSKEYASMAGKLVG